MISTHSVSGGGAVAVAVDEDVDAVDNEWASSLSGVTLMLTIGEVSESPRQGGKCNKGQTWILISSVTHIVAFILVSNRRDHPAL